MLSFGDIHTNNRHSDAFSSESHFEGFILELMNFRTMVLLFQNVLFLVH